jgi:Bacterial Ig-like domain (group 2)
LNVTVSSAALASIAISASHSSLPAGTSEQLTATGTYTDKSTKDITGSVTWTSSAPAVIAIGSGGTVQAKSVGSAAVSAVSSGVTGSTNLSVSSAVLAGISIAANSESVPVGDTLQLSAVGTLTDGSTQDLTGSVTWASSSPNVLGVRGAGLVAGLAIGAAGVTASSGPISAVKNISVSAAVLSSIALAPAGPMVPLGGSLQLAVTGTYSDGTTQDVTQQVTWSIDNPVIAAVTPAGMASGLQVGSTNVEASLGAAQTSGTLIVQPLLAVTYFDASSGSDSAIRITNPGTTGQGLCTMIYVFDSDQQMSECCGCLVSPDGLLSLSLRNNLLNNPLTGVTSIAGTVMLVSAQQPATGGCNASSITPAGTVLAWATHLPQSASGTMSSAEVPFSVSVLSTTLSSSLQAECLFIQQLGSGQGVCSCGNQP